MYVQAVEERIVKGTSMYFVMSPDRIGGVPDLSG